MPHPSIPEKLVLWAVLLLAIACLSDPASGASAASTDQRSPVRQNAGMQNQASPNAVETRGFQVEYEGGLDKRHPSLPSPSTLQRVTVALRMDGNVYHTPGTKGSPGIIEYVAIGDHSRTRMFSPGALVEVFQAVVRVFNEQCVYGIYVSVDPSQLSLVEGSLFDLRTSSVPLTLRVSVAETGSVRTTRIQLPADRPDPAATNSPKDSWIANRSPVTPGSLLKKEALQTYLERLNRFPGRRVDTALSSPENNSEGFDLHYLIREERPIFCHYEISNTGSGQSAKWRSQLGLEYRHLTGTDDVLRLGYATNDFQASNSANASYGFALLAPDYLKGRAYGSYSESTSEDLGQSLGTFDSNQRTLGIQLTWTPLYVHGWPIDLAAGGYWMAASVNNRPARIEGDENFFLPYIGFGTERSKELYTLVLNAQVESNLPSVAGTSAKKLTALGRTNTDANFSILRWNAQGSIWLDPLIYGKEWDSQTVWWKSLKSQEIAGAFRGQAALNNARLVPQMEAVVGGMDSVRGYPEAATAADSAAMGSVEYRFHIARRLLKPASLGEKRTSNSTGMGEAETARESIDTRPARSFAVRPQRLGEVPDWDLVLRTFFDAAKTHNTRAVRGLEANKTLLGAGFGFELITYRPTYFSVRTDLGFALKDDSQFASHKVHAGDARLHMSATIAW